MARYQALHQSKEGKLINVSNRIKWKLINLGRAFDVSVIKAAQSVEWLTDISIPMFLSVVTYLCCGLRKQN